MANQDLPLLNGVNINVVAGLIGKIQEEPDVAATKWNALVKWKGGFQSEATIREFPPIPSDEPSAIGGTDRRLPWTQP